MWSVRRKPQLRRRTLVVLYFFPLYKKRPNKFQFVANRTKKLALWLQVFKVNKLSIHLSIWNIQLFVSSNQPSLTGV